MQLKLETQLVLLFLALNLICERHCGRGVAQLEKLVSLDVVKGSYPAASLLIHLFVFGES